MAQGFSRKPPKVPTANTSNSKKVTKAQPKRGQRIIPPKRKQAIQTAQLKSRLSSNHIRMAETLMVSRLKGTASGGCGASEMMGMKIVKVDPILLETAQVAKARRLKAGQKIRKPRHQEEVAVSDQAGKGRGKNDSQKNKVPRLE